MKRSKRQRKFVNSMRAMGDVPWPARRFRYPPTFAGAALMKRVVVGRCERKLGESVVRRGWRRKRVPVEQRCGGTLVLRRGTLGRRRVYCVSCKERTARRRRVVRLEQQLTARVPVRQAREQDVGRFRSLLRRGQRGT